MKTTTINKKEYKVADAVVKEIEWLNIQVRAAKEIGRQIDDLDDEFYTVLYNYQHKKLSLLNEIKNL